MGEFWSEWLEEYVRNLPPNKGNMFCKEVKVGSVVLIEGEGNRFDWPLGVVESIYPGKDGLVRAVDIKTAKGKITRLRDLEISPSESDIVSTEKARK